MKLISKYHKEIKAQNNFEYLLELINDEENEVRYEAINCLETLIPFVDILPYKACEIIIEAKADFAKTSTGFVKNGVGAKVEDVELMAEVLKGSNVKIKASGGIKTKEQATSLINAGATRLGTSSGVKLVEKN